MITIDTIRDHNRRAGFHWFDPDTLRFFGSRIHANVYPTEGGAFFVSSEWDGYFAHPRRYTVRTYDATTGEVGTAGDFQQYATRNGAHAAARRMSA